MPTSSSLPRLRSFIALLTNPYAGSWDAVVPRGPRLESASSHATPASAVPFSAIFSLQHRASVERLLAVARLVTGVVLFGAIASNTGALHSLLAKQLMAAYIAYAAVVLVVVWTRAGLAIKTAKAVHVADLLWAGGATSVSGGASSHFFPLFAFLLAAAAYRWGFRRTLIDAAIVVAIVSVESIVSLAGATAWPFEFDWFVLWVPYLFVLAVLFGALAERMHVLGFQTMAIGRVMAEVGQASSLTAAVRFMLQETLSLFGSQRGQLVSRESESGRVFLWRAELLPDGQISVSLEEISNGDYSSRLFHLPPNISTFEARRRDDRHGAAVVAALGVDGNALNCTFEVPPEVVSPARWESLLGAVVNSGQGFTARLYVLDPASSPKGQLRLGFLHGLVRQVTPALVDLYLLRGLRARTESRERARLSRELHDGVIQSLAGLEMRLESMRHHASTLAPALVDDLAKTRDILHEEGLRARQIMQRLRASDIDARRLSYALTDLVERFSRETTISAELDWAVDLIDLMPHECQEVMAIVQEALVNVRRHSQASKVTVRVEADAGGWGLIVEDNGRGLGFTGSRSHDEMEAQRNGPRVIRERVAGLGGTLQVVSSGAGTRLEMMFQKSNASSAV